MPGRAPWGAGPGIPKRVGRRASNYLCTGGKRQPPNRRESQIMAAIVALMFVFLAVYSIFS